MNRIYYIMGKSASGKDTLFHRLQTSLGLRSLVLFTTRPMRSGEVSGREYHFIDSLELDAMRRRGEIIEVRSYQTVQGVWTYCTGRSSCDLSGGSLLGVGTLESFAAIRDALGADRVIPVYIEVDDRTRLLRAIDREQCQAKPDYEELCRRFLADAADFSEAHLAENGISRRFVNDDLNRCLAEIEAYIRSMEEQT